MSDKIFMKEITLPIVETGENETYSFVQTDADLDTAGDAADAKAVGDELTNLKQDLEGLDVYTLGLYPQMSVADTAVASFTDGADDIPVKSLTVDITPVQSGSGDPSPSNVRPISGWTGANVSVFDVNLFDKSKATPNSAINAQGEVVSGALYVSDFISVIPDTDYYMVNIETSAHARPLVFYGADKSLVSVEAVSGAGDAVSFEKHIPSNVYYIRIMAHPDYIDSAGVNYPSTDHDYHAYKGNVYSISFPTEAGTVYGGTLDVTNGVLTVDRAIVNLGTLGWTYEGDGLFKSRNMGSVAKFLGTILCEIFANYEGPLAAMPDKSIATTNSQAYMFFRAKDTTYSDATTFTSAVNGSQLVYELVTPVTYQFDPTEVATILGQNNIFADTGNINELTYRADLKSYIDEHING